MRWSGATTDRNAPMWRTRHIASRRARTPAPSPERNTGSANVRAQELQRVVQRRDGGRRGERNPRLREPERQDSLVHAEVGDPDGDADAEVQGREPQD